MFRSTSGMVARNDRGEVLASQATLEEATASRFAAEACACTQAVRLRIQMGARKVEIEGDALVIIKKCQSNNEDKSEIGAYIRDIKQLATNFQTIRFKYTQRSSNQMTHFIATECLKRGEEMNLERLKPLYAVDSLCPSRQREREPD
ncbi:hypothetical protein Gotur_027999 [Gossypium turneri]